MVIDFVSFYSKLLVKNPDDIKVEINNIDDSSDEITIYAKNEDVGKLIGKEGRMINSIKTVISGCKAKGGRNYRVNVKASS
ncbi:KH domain RNA binding protein YlqC [hydrothermal vent metagenome]|uniref:KH domain RNA binding protein YlqC n=1 Tax=hydrothermal vent metagenome TaxID=652676 RepID=A0A1W1C8E9_9ZZZZ